MEPPGRCSWEPRTALSGPKPAPESPDTQTLHPPTSFFRFTFHRTLRQPRCVTRLRSSDDLQRASARAPSHTSIHCTLETLRVVARDSAQKGSLHSSRAITRMEETT